jgi:hypothetical protein
MKTSKAEALGHVCPNGVRLAQDRKGRRFVKHLGRLPNGQKCTCSPAGEKDVESVS